jgi:hypothetical protein
VARTRSPRRTKWMLFALAALAGTLAPAAAWAVDGGYGPGSSQGASGGGTFTHVITAQTVGSGPAVIHAYFDDSRYVIDIPRGEFAQSEELELLGQDDVQYPCNQQPAAVAAFRTVVSGLDGTPFDSGLAIPARAFVFNPSISSQTRVYFVTDQGGLQGDDGATIHEGLASVVLQGEPSVVISSGSGSSCEKGTPTDRQAPFVRREVGHWRRPA